MALIRCGSNGGGVEIVPFTPTGQDYSTNTAGTNFEVGHTYIVGFFDQSDETVYDVRSGGVKLVAAQKVTAGAGTGGFLIFRATSNTVVTGSRQWSPFYELVGDVSVPT